MCSATVNGSTGHGSTGHGSTGESHAATGHAVIATTGSGDIGYRLLRKDGRVAEMSKTDVAALHSIDGEVDSLTLTEADIAFDQLAITFNGRADGRGYSLARFLLRNMSYSGQLYVAGYQNPDQLGLAFQTGFDGVLVTSENWSGYTEAVWQAALKPLINLSYASTESPTVRSIWQARHSG